MQYMQLTNYNQHLISGCFPGMEVKPAVCPKQEVDWKWSGNDYS